MKQTFVKKELPFEVRTIGWLRQNKAWLESPLQLRHYQIVWMTAGQGQYCIDLEQFSILTNRIYFIPPGRMQRIKTVIEPEGYVLTFAADFLSPSEWRPDQEVRILAMEDHRSESMLKNVIREMMQEFDQDQPLGSDVLRALLGIFLLYLKRLSASIVQKPTPSKKVHLFNSFYSKVDKDFLTKRLVADYASELSVTPNYLSDVVKRVTGYSASYHIQQRTVLEAKRMALYSDANMKVIAYKLGFDDLSHFSKFFKNATGINFSEFRSRSMSETVEIA